MGLLGSHFVKGAMADMLCLYGSARDEEILAIPLIYFGLIVGLLI